MYCTIAKSATSNGGKIDVKFQPRYLLNVVTKKVPVILFLLYKVVLAFKSVDKYLACDHSNESYFFMMYKIAVSALSLYETLVWYYSNGRHCLVMLCKLVITYKSVRKTLVCDHSNQ